MRSAAIMTAPILAPAVYVRTRTARQISNSAVLCRVPRILVSPLETLGTGRDGHELGRISADFQALFRSHPYGFASPVSPVSLSSLVSPSGTGTPRTR